MVLSTSAKGGKADALAFLAANLKLALPNADFRALVQSAAPGGAVVDEFTHGLDIAIHKR